MASGCVIERDPGGRVVPGAEAEVQPEDPAPGRVLFVDDYEDLRRMLAPRLRRAGYVVTEAEGGRRAVDLALHQTFDLVVSDVHMPDMDGIELLCALHELDPDLPVLLMSGAPDLTSAMKAIEYGVFEYLTKPVPFEKLCVSLKKALETRRQRVKRKDALEQFQSSARELKRLPRVGADQEWTGALLGGRYRVGALLGSGGMGTVYEAVREDLAQMRVAIKVLQDGLSTDAEHLARFRREAETVAALDHPNIVRILDFQAPAGEPAFIVMERLEGASLGAVLTAEGPFGPGRTAFIATQVLVALAAAHRANVIHRDLKPDNVFLTAMSGVRDLVKLLDFGIAKLLGGPDVQKLTQTGAVMGTPAYMAPEHARGAYVDRRSDIYAVGCVMYEALTGRAPFQAENYNALLFAIQASDPTSLAELRPDLDSDLVAIVECAMAKVPEARFQSAEAMAEALAPWASPNPSTRRAAPNSSAMAFAATMLPASEDPELQKK